ncbi:50S ribosomal protein L21e [Candidatus Micrarchaeota archaeon]|nr:50S ribosomal protein L21e [Candidatus Micrarchaeota archaeon]
MKRSLGQISKRSRLLRKRVTERRFGLSKLLKKFKVGENVTVTPKMGYAGMPHPRYRGRSGVILSTRGKAYVISIRDHDAMKQLIIPSVHLQ